MEKKKMSLQIVNPNAAGIDIGSRMHVVTVDQSTENVRTFGVYTKNHQEVANFIGNQKEHDLLPFLNA